MHRVTATACFESPIGPIVLHTSDAALLGLRLLGQTAPAPKGGDTAHPILACALDQLTGWFAGRCQQFDLPLVDLPKGEGRQLRAAIAAIPYGETRTYGAVAAEIGSIARAVGQACKTNAYPLIIPCHRVTSSAGAEYYSAGDGPRTKSWLLDFEYNQLPLEKRTRLI
jgi:methylated-DNA-[protein]-cysteine S-methyltransferase